MKKFTVERTDGRMDAEGHNIHLWNQENMFEAGVVRANEC